MSNLETVQGAYEAFSRGDIEAVLAIFDPDVEWVEPEIPGSPYAGTRRGPEAVASEVFAVLPSLWDEFGIEPEEWIDGDDRVAMLGRIKIGKDGRAESVRSAHLWTFRAGKAIRFEHITDTLATARVLGSV